MKISRLLTCLFLAVSLLAPIIVFSQDAEKPAEEVTVGDGIIGEKAPELVVEQWFQLPAGKDKMVISDFKDKVLVMLLFQAGGKGTDMGLTKLKELSEHYKADPKVAFLLVQTPLDGQLNKRSPERLKTIAKEQGFEFPLGHYNWVAGFPGMVTPAGTYKNSHLPWFVVVDPSGIVKFNGVPFSIDVEFAKERIDEMAK